MSKPKTGQSTEAAASQAQNIDAEEAALMAQLEAEEAAAKKVKADAGVAKAVESTRVYHVAPGASLWFDGKTHAEFEALKLTDAQAKELGAQVVPGLYVAPVVEDVATRSSGRYRVRKDAGALALSRVQPDGATKRFHVYPDVVELSGEEARDLADVVEPV